MAFSINTNIASLQAQNYLQKNSNFQSQTISQVTSGLRIVNSGDDAAGLAIANGLRSDESVLTQGIRNANDGIATLQTVDGGMNNISTLLDRARTLATQSASGTYTGSRDTLNSEFQSVMSEINRQAQSIGLNQGGQFAKALSVFIGGGKGTTSTDVLSNGSVGVDLSNATVDTKGLGLSTYQALGTGNGANAMDLGTDSATSVAKIMTAQSSPTTMGFTFSGAAFSGSNAITVTVNTSAVKDTDSLVNAVNTAIQSAAGANTAQAKAFAAAGVTANISTDANGRQQLSFTSGSAAFQVQANDRLSNAFMGNFSNPLTAIGLDSGNNVTASNALAAASATSGSENVVLTFGGDLTGSTTIAIASGDAVNAIKTKIDTALTAYNTANSTNLSAVYDGNNKLVFKSGGSSTNFSISVGATDGNGTLGLPASTTVTSADASRVNSGGVQESSQLNDTKAFTFVAYTGSDTQTLTFSGTHENTNTQYNFQVSLNATTDNSLTATLTDINSQLQASGDPSLMKIVAVRDSNTGNGQDGIRFMSTDQFSVNVGTNSGSTTRGIKDVSTNAPGQGENLNSIATSGGAVADISNQYSAQQAVTTLSNAVSALGNAQAVVGKGENLFNYAVNLAQSQVTSEASSESQIRDANLAQEAANLTKAQILVQAGTAALAQANSAPQQLLSLLQGH